MEAPLLHTVFWLDGFVVGSICVFLQRERQMLVVRVSLEFLLSPLEAFVEALFTLWTSAQTDCKENTSIVYMSVSFSAAM